MIRFMIAVHVDKRRRGLRTFITCITPDAYGGADMRLYVFTPLNPQGLDQGDPNWNMQGGTYWLRHEIRDRSVRVTRSGHESRCNVRVMFV